MLNKRSKYDAFATRGASYLLFFLFLLLYARKIRAKLMRKSARYKKTEFQAQGINARKNTPRLRGVRFIVVPRYSLVAKIPTRFA